MPTGRRVFISYSRADSWYADRIVETLERAGHDVWIDRQDIAGGSPWASSIVEAIRQSDVAVLILSRTSVQSPEVRKEVNLAGSQHLPIVPVVLPPVDIPDEIKYHIAGRNRVQFDRDNALIALQQVHKAVAASSTQGQERRQRNVLGCLVTIAFLAVLAGGVATVVTGRLPPWTETPACSSISATGQSTPSSSGVLIQVTFQTGDRAVAIPASRDVLVRGSGGFQYEHDQLISGSNWFFDQTIQARSSRTLDLGIADAGRGSDTVSLVIPGVHETEIPFLSCELIVGGVDVTFGS